MTTVLEARRLGKQYRGRWALRECDLSIPAGSVVGLVGPNGAGKTTLLHLATGLIKPSAGTIEVVGGKPAANRTQLAKVGFVAQDTPTYAAMSIQDHLRLGAHLNRGWDAQFARDRIDKLGLDPKLRAGRLSGGQRAQIALTMAIAKAPELLILDEPVAALDPLARREFIEALLEAVAAYEMSVVLSSHLISDLEVACDYLIVLAAGRVQLAGQVDQLLADHRQLTAVDIEPGQLPQPDNVVSSRRVDRKTTVVVRSDQPLHDPNWAVSQVDLEELVLAYMNQAAEARGRRTEQEAVK
jgi:ABC-2 type transport system ATP-binding protein